MYFSADDPGELPEPRDGELEPLGSNRFEGAIEGLEGDEMSRVLMSLLRSDLGAEYLGDEELDSGLMLDFEGLFDPPQNPERGFESSTLGSGVGADTEGRELLPLPPNQPGLEGEVLGAEGCELLLLFLPHQPGFEGLLLTGAELFLG